MRKKRAWPYDTVEPHVVLLLLDLIQGLVDLDLWAEPVDGPHRVHGRPLDVPQQHVGQEPWSSQNLLPPAGKINREFGFGTWFVVSNASF